MSRRASTDGWRIAVLLVGLAVLCAWSPVPAAPAVERWFSLTWYPWLQRLVTPLSNRLPFALFDLLVVAALLVVVGTVVGAVRAMRPGRRAAPITLAARRLMALAALVYLTFLAMWGLNYRRVPMRGRLRLDLAAPSSEQVTRLGLDAVEQMNALYDRARARLGQRGVAGRCARRRVCRRAARTERGAGRGAGPVEGHRVWTVLRWTGVDGMLNPFALEVLANPDLLPFERPFVAAHEWSHLAGFADESEASFVGWLTCMRGSTAAQYSGWLYLYWEVSGEVNPAERERLWSAVASGPRRDLEAITARLRKGQLPLLRSASWRVYDQYFKANRVDAGVRSYGEVVTLILQARFEPGWMPVRR